MKATIERATLLRCLSHVQSVVERRNTIPILSNVFLAATGRELTLKATDLEREVQKVALTGNWYLRPGTTVAVQWFFRARQNTYRAIRDNTVSTSDRYPAYIANQDFETSDFNVRVSHKFAANFRSVTRGPAVDRHNALVSGRSRVKWTAIAAIAIAMANR